MNGNGNMGLPNNKIYIKYYETTFSTPGDLEEPLIFVGENTEKYP